MKWLISLAVLVFCSSVSEALTLSELLTRTRVYLRDTQTSSQRFSDIQLTSFLNDSQKEANLRTFAVAASTRFYLTPGTTEYSLPDSNIVVLRVTLDNFPMPERTLSFLDDSNSTWVLDPAGTPQEYYIRTSSSLVDGIARESVGFHPVSTGTLRVDIDYLAQPVDLSQATDVPFGGDNKRLYPFHHILAFRSAYLGWIAIGDVNMAAIYLREYESLIPILEAVTKTRLSYNPNLRGNLQPPVQQGGQQ